MLRIAVIGVGHWGPNLVANFHEDPRSQVTWMVDRDAERRRVAAKRFPGIAVTDDSARAIDAPDVDAVVIATPTSTHEALAAQALEAGRHVLVEKPLAHDAASAQRICELAARHERVLMVGHVFVYNAASVYAKQLIDAGELGRLYTITMQRTNLGPIRVDVNAAWDLAAHDISLANYWLDAQPLTVSAVGGAWINRGIEDTVFATLRYPDEVLVHLHASWLHPRKTREISVVGERRMLSFDDMQPEQPLALYDKQVSLERSQPVFVDSFETFRMSVREGEETRPEVPLSQPLRNECAHFLECVLDGATSRSGPREGLAVVYALEALTRSLAERGREVEVAQVASDARGARTGAS